MLESPALRGLRIIRGAEDHRGLSGLEADFDAIQAIGEALAKRLQIGFLASPTTKESLDLRLARQRLQDFSFRAGKIMRRQIRDLHISPKAFQIHTDVPMQHNSKQSQAGGMGHTKMKRGWMLLLRETRLPIMVVRETQAAGIYSQITPQNAP